MKNKDELIDILNDLRDRANDSNLPYTLSRLDRAIDLVNGVEPGVFHAVVHISIAAKSVQDAADRIADTFSSNVEIITWDYWHGEPPTQVPGLNPDEEAGHDTVVCIEYARAFERAARAPRPLSVVSVTATGPTGTGPDEQATMVAPPAPAPLGDALRDERDPMAAVYREGCLARGMGVPRDQNPYTRLGQWNQKTEWFRGWDEAAG